MITRPLLYSLYVDNWNNLHSVSKVIFCSFSLFPDSINVLDFINSLLNKEVQKEIEQNILLLLKGMIFSFNLVYN